ncbi:hypothetical protein KAFR_0F01700 [Kazachstania africana CBS 2517]|uniref:Autophagy-related protein 27 n=1 Tax=Kazachstania africana (strain ATCC 22294 / BCRC 22015 / CBS 2517 / CECT 1963 / NBRC 1671 / NRRL Y-8276) TaxID=1071382 RepID=H2AWL7_KAZAF|nr:hypothetical protein KAFR_0F01700 [Kazachstania africana CBS 2517]CCF58767.1 hypothetical protein KAFR_0F01700 [Kazachstania africana CBS 2517]
MRSEWKLIVLSLLGFSLVQSLECSKHETIKKYQMDRFSVLGETEKDTPPSKTKEVWYANLCDENRDDNERPSDCDKNDVLCGLTEVSVPGKDTLTTQIISFSKSLAFTIEEGEDNLVFLLKGTKWGPNTIDAKLSFACNTNMKKDEIVSSTWHDQEIQIESKGPSGCLKDTDSGKHKDDGDKNNGEEQSNGGHFSWFTWLFVYALLFTLIYLIVVSYLQTRGGSFDDFRTEFTDRSIKFATSLPEFVKEVASKIFGLNRSSAARGGYSAV